MMEAKICSACKIEKPLTEYHRHKNGHRSVCKTCRKIERAIRYQQNREHETEYGKNYKINNLEKRLETGRKSSKKKMLRSRIWLNELKNVPCFDCKTQYPPCVMDFDHREPENKLFNISEALFSPQDKILLEIQKCDIICANCHRHREYIRRQNRGSKVSPLSKILNAFKQQPCQDCGKSFLPHMMDFDHHGNEKLFDISKPIKGSIKNYKPTKILLDEIAKCEIVCANCHRIRTFIK